MEAFFRNATKKCEGQDYINPPPKGIPVQLALSLALGLSAFFSFCILRPRWATLYAARRRRLDPNIGLPALPDTFLGWIPGLWRVTDEQVLASAGLDAFVFLAFFKLAIKLVAIMAFFALVVLLPINHTYIGDLPANPPNKPNDTTSFSYRYRPGVMWPMDNDTDDDPDDDRSLSPQNRFIWAYLIFTYFFSFIVLYFMNWETFRVIRIRQDYLGTQSTITDRTFRLSGLPKELKSEDKIKHLIEKLEIGDVESVTLCRDWSKIDGLMAKRGEILRKLEEMWSVYLGQKPVVPKPPEGGRRTNGESSNSASDLEAGEGVPGGDDEDVEAAEDDRLMAEGGNDTFEPALVTRERPQVRIWYGFLKLQSRLTDAIDYYEEKLRRLDEQILEVRQKECAPGDLAFVTMDSIAACQMAIQARIDPRPGQLLAKPAPAPSDIIWENTYLPRGIRRLRSWAVTIFVTFLSLIWLFPVVALASLISICTVEKLFPNASSFLAQHSVLEALVSTALPTVTVSLLNIAVPYLYDYLSYRQGMISRGDVELSIISKNFFFVFFNIFLVSAVSGTLSQFWAFLQEALTDTRKIALALAGQIETLGYFYTNFIMLQGIGLFPLRLLEVGSVSLYPISRMGAKTPRDFAEMQAPPIFSYGFYLPTALLIFLLCLEYSITRFGYLIEVCGLIYFLLGYFTYKYQLLYAMDQPQHATGGAWRVICYRMLLAVLLFQITMSGIMALRQAFWQALGVIPLFFCTIWYSYYFRRRFEPLTKFIALRSIRVEIDEEDAAALDDGYENEGPRVSQGLLRRGSTVDEDKEKGLKFVNPSLIAPLSRAWIYKDPPPQIADDDDVSTLSAVEPQQMLHSAPSEESSVSLGDTHVWRDASNDNA